ncbi:MAG: energy-coupling factor transporter transmembrane component T family protein [Anaerolineae bacterium]
MASLEGLRNVSIGQYLPTGSLIHRLDARFKLGACLLLLIALLLAQGYLVNIALLLVMVALVSLARLPASYVSANLKPALPFIIILSLMQLLFYGRGPNNSAIWLKWGPLIISAEGVQLVIVSLFRFLGLMFIISLLTNTTTSSALTHGVEWWLRPLTALGLPGHELALVMAIALRFLPILGEELEAIGQAQASRTIANNSTNRWHFIAGARRTANLIVPLFVSTLRRADEMALAMQARCYQGGKGRTQLNPMIWHRLDTFASLLVCLLCALVIYLRSVPLP